MEKSPQMKTNYWISQQKNLEIRSGQKNKSKKKGIRPFHWTAIIVVVLFTEPLFLILITKSCSAAIESTSNFKVGHGEAVAIGMLAAARISRQLGILAPSELERLEKLITKAGLPTTVPKLDLERLVFAIKHDKKVEQGKVMFILPRSLGEVFITADVSLSLVKQVLVY